MCGIPVPLNGDPQGCYSKPLCQSNISFVSAFIAMSPANFVYFLYSQEKQSDSGGDSGGAIGKQPVVAWSHGELQQPAK